MAFNQLKEKVTEVDADVRSYLKYSESYIELKVFKILMRLVTTFFQAVLVGSMVLLALFIFSIAVSYALGEVLGNIWYGFAFVSAFFLFMALLIYIFRKIINKPILRFFSLHYFDRS